MIWRVVWDDSEIVKHHHHLSLLKLLFGYDTTSGYPTLRYIELFIRIFGWYQANRPISGAFCDWHQDILATPYIMILLSIIASFFLVDSVAYLPIFGTYMSWIYLRYLQRISKTNFRADPSAEFAFATFFLEFIRILSQYQVLSVNCFYPIQNSQIFEEDQTKTKSTKSSKFES